VGGVSRVDAGGGKFTLYEGGVRGHCFINGGVLPASRRGQTFDSLVSVVDWYSTYAALSGVPTSALANTGPRPIDGFDLTAALLEGRPSPRKEIVHKPLNRECDKRRD